MGAGKGGKERGREAQRLIWWWRITVIHKGYGKQWH
jgi:hypothetical protein